MEGEKLFATRLWPILYMKSSAVQFLPPQCEDAEWVTPVFQRRVIRGRGKQKADNLFCTSVRGLYSLPVQLLAVRTAAPTPTYSTCEMQRGQLPLFKTKICASSFWFAMHALLLRPHWNVSVPILNLTHTSCQQKLSVISVIIGFLNCLPAVVSKLGRIYCKLESQSTFQ